MSAPLGELKLHRLLVAIDGSANAELAVSAAITAARRDNASVTLLTVGPDLSTSPAAWSVPVTGVLDQQAVDDDQGEVVPVQAQRPVRAPGAGPLGQGDVDGDGPGGVHLDPHRGPGRIDVTQDRSEQECRHREIYLRSND